MVDRARQRLREARGGDIELRPGVAQEAPLIRLDPVDQIAGEGKMAQFKVLAGVSVVQSRVAQSRVQAGVRVAQSRVYAGVSVAQSRVQAGVRVAQSRVQAGVRVAQSRVQAGVCVGRGTSA